jgi:hypothetical protein
MIARTAVVTTSSSGALAGPRRHLAEFPLTVIDCIGQYLGDRASTERCPLSGAESVPVHLQPGGHFPASKEQDDNGNPPIRTAME